MKVSRSLGKTAKSWGSVGKVSPVPLVEFVPNPGELFLLLQPTFLFATLRMLLKRREGGGQHLGVWFLEALCNGGANWILSGNLGAARTAAQSDEHREPARS